MTDSPLDRIRHPAARVRRAMRFAALLVAVLLTAAACLAYVGVRGMRESSVLRGDVRASQAAAARLISTVQDAEVGQRGFLLTGDGRYLEPYRAALAREQHDLADLHAHAGNLPADRFDERESPGLGRIDRLIKVKMEELARTVALFESGRPDEALALVRTNVGKQAMDELHVAIAGLQDELAFRLARARAQDLPGYGWIAAACLAIMASGLLAWLAVMHRRGSMDIADGLARGDRFTRAFNLAQGMIRGADGRIAFWSDGNQRLYGYTAAEAVGQISHELLRTQFPEPLADIQGSLDRGGQWHGELVHRGRDGKELHVASQWLRYSADPGANGDVLELSSDITAAKQASDLLHTIIETAPGLIYAKDRDGRMLLANRAALALIGKSWAEVQGRTDKQFVDDPVQGEAVMANDLRVMDSGQPKEIEELVGGYGAEKRAWYSIKTPMRDKHGTVSGLVGVSIELTERKRIEATLRQAQRMEGLGQLTAGVAHDFNNLLQIITGSVDVALAQPVLDDEGRDCLASAVAAAARGAVLVHRLLAFSLNQPLNPVLLDVRGVIADVSALLARTLGSRIRLETRLAEQDWLIHADGPQLENCLVNLAVNARDAMPAGGLLRIEVHNASSAEARDAGLPPAEHVCITVRDSGAGMTSEILARAFEPFFTTKPVGKGTGLGLSMTQGFARQSGGDARIESAMGVGTAVSLWMPRAFAAALSLPISPPVPEPAPRQARPVEQDRGRLRVMVVDDDDAVRRVLSKNLSLGGFNSTSVESGTAALALFRAGASCDLLVTDQSMPGLTGRELIEQVSVLRPALPIILITGYSNVADLDQLSGRVRVLAKPIGRAAFIQQVEAALELQS